MPMQQAGRTPLRTTLGHNVQRRLAEVALLLGAASALSSCAVYERMIAAPGSEKAERTMVAEQGADAGDTAPVLSGVDDETAARAAEAAPWPKLRDVPGRPETTSVSERAEIRQDLVADRAAAGGDYDPDSLVPPGVRGEALPPPGLDSTDFAATDIQDIPTLPPGTVPEDSPVADPMSDPMSDLMAGPADGPARDAVTGTATVPVDPSPEAAPGAEGYTVTRPTAVAASDPLTGAASPAPAAVTRPAPVAALATAPTPVTDADAGSAAEPTPAQVNAAAVGRRPPPPEAPGVTRPTPVSQSRGAAPMALAAPAAPAAPPRVPRVRARGVPGNMPVLADAYAAALSESAPEAYPLVTQGGGTAPRSLTLALTRDPADVVPADPGRQAWDAAASRAVSARFGPRAARGLAGAEKAAVIYYDVNATGLTAGDRTIVTQVAGAWRQQRDALIRVVGHASAHAAAMAPAERERVNRMVSEARAQNVAEALMAAGVPRSAIVLEAVGDRDPAYQETAPTGRAGNRRTEIYLLP